MVKGVKSDAHPRIAFSLISQAMKRNLFAFTLLALLLNSACNEKERTQSENANSAIEETESTEQADLDSTRPGLLNYYLLDSFAESPFKAGSIVNLFSKSPKADWKIKREVVRDNQIPFKADSMLTVRVGWNKLIYYKNKEELIPYFAKINDNSFSFKRDIQIGMMKTNFAQKFEKLKSEESLPSVIQIANPNNREVYNFIFYQDTLGMVIYDSAIE